MAISEERTKAMQDLLLLYLRNAMPSLKHHPIQVQYRPRCPFLYMARRGRDGVIITTSAKPHQPTFMRTLRHAARAALEIAEGRTSAVSVRFHEEIH